MPDSNSAAADFAHAEIGIVCALPIELGAFLDRCQKVKKYTGGDFVFRGGFYDGIRIAVVESGMGFARARRATQAMIEGHSPRWLLSCGFAGALRENIPVGSILVADFWGPPRHYRGGMYYGYGYGSATWHHHESLMEVAWLRLKSGAVVPGGVSAEASPMPRTFYGLATQTPHVELGVPKATEINSQHTVMGRW